MRTKARNKACFAGQVDRRRRALREEAPRRRIRPFFLISSAIQKQHNSWSLTGRHLLHSTRWFRSCLVLLKHLSSRVAVRILNLHTGLRLLPHQHTTAPVHRLQCLASRLLHLPSASTHLTTVATRCKTQPDRIHTIRPPQARASTDSMPQTFLSHNRHHTSTSSWIFIQRHLATRYHRLMLPTQAIQLSSTHPCRCLHQDKSTALSTSMTSPTSMPTQSQVTSTLIKWITFHLPSVTIHHLHTYPSLQLQAPIRAISRHLAHTNPTTAQPTHSSHPRQQAM